MQIYEQNIRNNRSINLTKSILTLSFAYLMALGLTGDSGAQAEPIFQTGNKTLSHPLTSRFNTSNIAMSAALANAMRYITDSDYEEYSENVERVLGYSSASEAIGDSFALDLATLTAFDNLLHSEEFEEFRNHNDITTVEGLVNAVLHITISLDFDRSINDSKLEINPETGMYEVVGTKIGGAQQIYINELQVKLIAGRWVYHRNEVLNQYSNVPTIVSNGELTETGNLIALIKFANWSNIFRVISDVGAFRDHNISPQVILLINTLDDNLQLTAMIDEQSRDTENFLMLDYNAFYPGTTLYDYLLQVNYGNRKPHKGIRAIRFHESGGIEIYYDLRYKEDIRNVSISNSNQSRSFLTEDFYFLRLSSFQREKILQISSSTPENIHPSLLEES